MCAVTLPIAVAKARISRSLSRNVILGSAKITDLPPPWGRPAAAFLKVIARASRKASSLLTSGAIRTPPIAGPQAILSIATTAFRPTEGREI
jgi:hypothetical protein